MSQGTEFYKCVQILNSDLHTLDSYFKQWSIRPNPNKTETSTFCLNNKPANYIPNISFSGHNVYYNPSIKYLRGYTVLVTYI